MTYTIEKITTLIGARRYGNADANIGFLLTDSRSLCFPEETLFFALKTERHDGHAYIPELYRRGVRNFVVTGMPEGYADGYPEANFLKVTDARRPCNASPNVTVMSLMCLLLALQARTVKPL